MYFKQMQNKKAFTFMEVMVVVVIIGLLAGAVAIKVGDYIDKAKVNRAKSDIATISNAVESYYAEHGVYPSNEQGLKVLSIKNMKDPWKRKYQYNQPGVNWEYEVISYGADGKEGGKDQNQDITSDSINEASE